MSTITQTVAENIRRIAYAQEFDHDMLRLAMGIDAKSLDLTLQGVRAPRIDELAALAHAMGVPVFDLIAHRYGD